MSKAWVATTVLAAALLGACGGSGPGSASTPKATTSSASAPKKLRARRIGALPVPLQLPSATTLPGDRVLLLGGLSAADVSTDGIVAVDPSGSSRTVGRLPAAVHDAAASTIAGRAYMFGGGDAAPSAAILRVGEDGRTANAGRLPAGASDVAAATIGRTAYVVGGYTGTVPLRSIIAFSPGRPARQVALMSRPLRYAAVAAVGHVLLIAGGTSGTTAERAVLRFDPGTGRVVQIGSLPHPLTHASGATLGGRFYVLGGRGAALDSASAGIWSVDPAKGRVRAAGRLPVALSDVAAASGTRGIVLAGGRDATGRVRSEIMRAETAR